jgi:hypothetical protein
LIRERIRAGRESNPLIHLDTTAPPSYAPHTSLDLLSSALPKAIEQFHAARPEEPVEVRGIVNPFSGYSGCA